MKANPDSEFPSEHVSDPTRESGHVNRSRPESAVVQPRIPEMVKKSASENWEEEDEEEEFPSEPESDPIRQPGHVNRSRSAGAEIQRRIPEMIKRSASENWDLEEVVEEERDRPATSRTVERNVDIRFVPSRHQPSGTKPPSSLPIHQFPIGSSQPSAITIGAPPRRPVFDLGKIDEIGDGSKIEAIRDLETPEFLAWSVPYCRI